jgi:hypothetical protein
MSLRVIPLPSLITIIFLLSYNSLAQKNDGKARFTFLSTPPNSMIFVDGNAALPDSSGWFTIEPGIRKIELLRSEKLLYTSTQLFTENEEKKYTFYCNEDCGGVEVHSVPPGAHLVIDEEYNAVTPAIHTLLSPGFHSLKLDMPGWTTVYKDFEITEKTINQISINMERSKSFRDSMDVKEHLKHSAGKKVFSAFLSVITASLGSAAIWYDYTAKHYVSKSNKASEQYDRSSSNFESIKNDYYQARTNAEKAIKNRNVLAIATGVSLTGFIISLTF